VPDGVALRVFFADESLPRVILPYIADRGAAYGRDPSLGLSESNDTLSASKKLLVDFSSPNLAQQFSTRHLRSTILGAHIAALHERMGWHVTRVNYLGDWGKHIGLLEAGWTQFGSEEKLVSDPLRHLLDVYTQIDDLLRKEAELRPKLSDESSEPAEDLELLQADFDSRGLHGERDTHFKSLEAGAKDAVALWRRFRELSIAEYGKLYARFGIAFDEYSGESQVSSNSIARVENELRQAGVYEEEHGAWKVDFKKHGVKGAPKGILRFRNGTTTYLLRDIAAVLDREEKYGFDKMIYIVEGQESHFQSVFKALELMGRKDLVSKLQQVHFSKGPEMPLELAGDANGHASDLHVQQLGDFLDRSQQAALNLLAVDIDRAAAFGSDDPSIADNLGVSALVVQALEARPKAAVTFDLTRSMTFYGETGPALQYWHLRLCSLLRSVAGPASPTFDLVDGEEYGDILRILAQWPDAAKAAARSPEFIGILPYLFRLIDEVASIVEGDEEDAQEKAGTANGSTVAAPNASDALVLDAARQVLENGMGMLGMPVLAR
jgi:arginyl-tRNA synthetase